jgi:hypothetical protein
MGYLLDSLPRFPDSFRGFDNERRFNLGKRAVPAAYLSNRDKHTKGITLQMS